VLPVMSLQRYSSSNLTAGAVSKLANPPETQGTGDHQANETKKSCMIQTATTLRQNQLSLYRPTQMSATHSPAPPESQVYNLHGIFQFPSIYPVSYSVCVIPENRLSTLKL